MVIHHRSVVGVCNQPAHANQVETHYSLGTHRVDHIACSALNDSIILPLARWCFQPHPDRAL
jgi:hypothetical protein